MRRKTAVMCAAADDEDLGELFSNRDSEKRVRRAEPEPREEARENTKRKEKAFAWMDSDDEEDNDADRQAEKADAEEEQDDEEVSVEKLDQVQSFGRMMLLAPSLQKKLEDDSFGVVETVATCRALARSKFFDSDLLQGLCEKLVRHLGADALDVSQANDAVVCLSDLNFYNKSVFSAVSTTFKPKITQLDANMRSRWLDAFRTFGHSPDRDFMQILETPPLPIISPSYRKVRCSHFAKGKCELAAMCTFAHDMKAPLSLSENGREDLWRSRSTMMTQDQKSLGQGAYGCGPLSGRIV